VLVVLTACGASPNPAVTPGHAVAGYPVRRHALSDAERKTLAQSLESAAPGWTIAIDEMGMIDHATRAGEHATAMTDDDRAAILAFVAAHQALLGLDAVPHELPPVDASGHVTLAQPGGRSQIQLTAYGTSGHWLPGWRDWQKLDDDAVAEPYVGIDGTERSRECSANENRPCDPVGPNDCRGPSWGPERAIRVKRGDLWVAQHYWYPVHRAGFIEMRYIAELRSMIGSCGEYGGSIRMVSVKLPSFVDGITGEPIDAL
ncbi:MAG TPA: hypothetical protein VGG28_34945, partial [Kofleriaceae bacterium]